MDEQELIDRLLDSLGRAGLAKVLPSIESETLRAAIRVARTLGVPEVALLVPHYWAVWYHDGRPGFTGNPFLIFFANPDNDPRIAGRTSPERLAQTRRLTRAEFQDGLLRNEIARQNGQPPYMIVTPSVGPAGPHPFFENDGGMAGFTEQVSNPRGEQCRIFDDFIQSLVLAEESEAILRL